MGAGRSMNGVLSGAEFPAVSFSISHADERDSKRQDLRMLQGVGGEESAGKHGGKPAAWQDCGEYFYMEAVGVGEERSREEKIKKRGKGGVKVCGGSRFGRSRAATRLNTAPLTPSATRRRPVHP